ncbi:hypothetical protein MPSEU_000535700 [Mayamaea pseudoterrestris]|nr:hypothetical protein MPSEU_000535700 [Mayamaea pseudoterrestris]
MGADGGVIASSRRYLRGAGMADTAGDATKQSSSKDHALEVEELERSMTTCALTGQQLEFGRQAIVACPYGKLYAKEAAIEALLRRKTHGRDDLGTHVHKLRDLHEVRFHTSKGKDGLLVPTCPVTEKELNGQIPAYLLLPGNLENANVLSERALTEMKELLEEYGPIEKRIRLAPPSSVLEEIKKELEGGQAESKLKKRKQNGNDVAAPSKKSRNKLVDKTRAKVSAAIQNNEVLSSIFTK